jgi:phenylalanyl-tRNA synthetase beta chain
MMFELSLAGVLAARPPGFDGVSKFPAVRRDIAVVIDKDLPVAEVERAVRESAGTVLRETLIFDVYAGSNVETGSKSVALDLILQDTSRTLNDDDVDRVMRAVNDRLSRDFNATIRE